MTTAAPKNNIQGASPVHPDHYHRFPIEPIRFIVENKLDWFQGNILKYTCRHDAKNGLEDIDKAARYLEMYKKYLAGDRDWWVKPSSKTREIDPLLVEDLIMQSGGQMGLPFPVRPAATLGAQEFAEVGMLAVPDLPFPSRSHD